MKFTVKRIAAEDIYKDILRIPEEHRREKGGAPIPENTLCWVCAAGNGCKGTRLWVRGNQAESDAVACMDERTRDQLGVKDGDAIDLSLSPVGVFGEICWAWRASEAAYRVAARLALISLALGLLGLALGVISLIHVGPNATAAPIAVNPSAAPNATTAPVVFTAMTGSSASAAAPVSAATVTPIAATATPAASASVAAIPAASGAPTAKVNTHAR